MKERVVRILGRRLLIIILTLCTALGIYAGLRYHRDRWARRLTDPDPYVRKSAVLEILIRQTVDGEMNIAVPELARCLNESDPRVRHLVLTALNGSGSAAVPFLIDAITSEDHRVRIAALEACGHPDPRYERRFTRDDDNVLLPYLLMCLKDPDTEIRGKAAKSLTYVCLGAGQEQVGIEALCLALADKAWYVRAEALCALGMIARLTKQIKMIEQAIPLIRRIATSHEDESLRTHAEWALMEIEERKLRDQERNP